MNISNIDFYLFRLEQLCSDFKRSMCMDHLPYTELITFKRYMDYVIDNYEKEDDVSSLSYSLDLLRGLYVLNNPNLLFDSKMADPLSVERLDDVKIAEQQVYEQTIRFYREHMQSESRRLYADFLTELNLYLSSRLIKNGIYIHEDFLSEIKLKANVSIPQIRCVIRMLQGEGYIDNDKITAKAFESLFVGSVLAPQMMRIQWKCMSKTSGSVNEHKQNIAALYVLFETLGVDLKKSYNRRLIEKVFLDSGELKKREMSDFLNGFKSKIEKSLNCEKNSDG